VAQGVRAGAGFVIYVNGSLYGIAAHQAGLESSDFRTETVAMSLGLFALTALKDSHSYSSIRIFIDCQSLIATLSRGPVRKSDSVCNSIWFQLSSISNISSVHVQWIPHIGIPGNTLAAWDQTELQYPSVLGPYRPTSGEGSNSEDETGGVPCPLHTGCALSHTSHYGG